MPNLWETDIQDRLRGQKEGPLRLNLDGFMGEKRVPVGAKLPEGKTLADYVTDYPYPTDSGEKPKETRLAEAINDQKKGMMK